MTKIRKGMTLSEIMLAVSILAIAFIPIIGVISSSLKATEKDDNRIKAMLLCQEKLGVALQFPFEFFTPVFSPYNDSYESPNANGKLTLVLGSETIKHVTYTSTLTVASETVTFAVPVVDFTQKPFDSLEDPNGWIKREDITVHDMVKRYTVTVTWRDPGDNPASDPKFYTLSVLKANIQR